MAEPRNTFEVIARHLVGAARPLIEAGGSLGGFQRLMLQLGFKVSSLPASFASLGTTVGSATLKIDLQAGSLDMQGSLALLADAKAIFDGIRSLGGGPVPAGANAAEFQAEVGERLTELLLANYLSLNARAAFDLLGLLNVVRVGSVPATATRPAFVRTQLAWSELPKFVSDPGGLPARAFKWGGPDFDARLLFDRLLGFALGLDFAASLAPADPELLRGYLGPPNVPAGSVRSLSVPFIATRFAGVPITASFDFLAVPPVGGALPGLVFEPHLPKEFPLSLALHPKVRLRLSGGTNSGPPFGIVMRPGSVLVRYPLAPATPPPPAGLAIGFDFTPAGPTVLLGDPKASHLEFASGSLDLKANFSNGTWSVMLGADLSGFKFVFDPGEGDSLLRFLIGGGKADIVLPLGLQWGRDGIRFGGSGSFDVVVHPHLSIGPATIDEIDFRFGVPAGPKPQLRLEIGAGISGTLGPVAFSLKGVGLRADVVFEAGNAGPLDLTFGFKPPNGVGLELDAGGFKGGGFMRLDPDKGEYEGMLELTFAEVISIRAVGVLSTRMPDGHEGFSLLIIVVTEFPPIQLSFGFTLVGVGGLLGLNRTVLLDPLQVGVRDGSLNSILFPVDVIANATRIIGDLKRVFPPQDGHFLIGPMAKLGWGTPTLISLSLGLILDIPRPMFAVIGVLRMALPAEDVPILHLQVSFAGSVDFERGQLQFDASLFDSRVLTFTLCGDMAVRVYWKENANFLLSVGGFHPSYTPPPMNLGEMARLGVVIFQGNPHISAQAYFAVTSNSVQFGARVEAYYGIDLFNVAGFLGLDVLINFNPFHFIAEIEAGLAVRSGTTVLFAIQLQLVLEGPTPWHARGRGSFRIGFIIKITISASFDVTFGDAQQTRLPPVDVLAALVAALGNLGNWRPRLPAGSNQHVVLRELPDPSTTLVMHPFGTLEVTQKLVPLHIAIQRFGSRSPDKGSVFTLAEVKLGAADAAVTNTREQFAPAQFFEMSDAEKISRPSFADYDAGILIGGDLAPQTDLMRTRDVEYELIYLPEHHPIRLRFGLAVGLAGFMARASAVSQSPVSNLRRSASALEERASLAAERYAVVSTDDLTLHAPNLVFDSATAADQALQRAVNERPELFGTIQVLHAGAVAATAGTA